MGLLETEIKELRQLRTRVLAGTVKAEETNALLAIYSQTEKRVKMMLQVFALVSKHQKVSLKQITNTNLIGDGSAIDLQGDIELEVIKCVERDEVITRADCLSFSGTTGNLKKCEGCDHFNITRKALLGEKK